MYVFFKLLQCTLAPLAYILLAIFHEVMWLGTYVTNMYVCTIIVLHTDAYCYIQVKHICISFKTVGIDLI